MYRCGETVAHATSRKTFTNKQTKRSDVFCTGATPKGVAETPAQIKRPQNPDLRSVSTSAATHVGKQNYFVSAVIFALCDSPETRAQEYIADESGPGWGATRCCEPARGPGWVC